MAARQAFTLQNLSEHDIDRAIVIYHSAEIAARKAKGEHYSRQQRIQGKKRAFAHYREIFQKAVAINDPSQEKLKGGYDNCKLAGYAWYGKCPSEQEKTSLGRLILPRYGHLKHLFVDAVHQGQGLGRSLFQMAAYELREAGFSRMRLLTERDNQGARELYDQLGGHTNDRTVCRDGYNEDMVEYTWKLGL